MREFLSYFDQKAHLEQAKSDVVNALNELGWRYNPEITPLGNVGVVIPVSEEQQSQFFETVGVSKEVFSRTFFTLLYGLNEVSTDYITQLAVNGECHTEDFNNKELYPEAWKYITYIGNKIEQHDRFFSDHSSDLLIRALAHDSICPAGDVEDQSLTQHLLTILPVDPSETIYEPFFAENASALDKSLTYFSVLLAKLEETSGKKTGINVREHLQDIWSRITRIQGGTYDLSTGKITDHSRSWHAFRTMRAAYIGAYLGFGLSSNVHTASLPALCGFGLLFAGFAVYDSHAYITTTSNRVETLMHETIHQLSSSISLEKDHVTKRYKLGLFHVKPV